MTTGTDPHPRMTASRKITADGKPPRFLVWTTRVGFTSSCIEVEARDAAEAMRLVGERLRQVEAVLSRM
jgi:hypothetical protein